MAKSQSGNQTPAGAWTPITLAALAGLGWGLLFGLVDGLFALLEGDPLLDLGRRLLALTYVAIFYALVLGLALALAGVVVWAILRLSRRTVSRAALLGLYSGLCAALAAFGYGLSHYQQAAPLVLVVLAIVAGGLAGWLAYAAAMATTRAAGRVLRTAILGLLAVGLVVLLGTVLYRHTVRDLPALNPRVTDQVATPERPTSF